MLTGRQAVGEYWRAALGQLPELHFELLAVYVGSDSLVLCYRNERGREASEAMVFGAGGKVTRACACYELEAAT